MFPGFFTSHESPGPFNAFFLPSSRRQLRLPFVLRQHSAKRRKQLAIFFRSPHGNARSEEHTSELQSQSNLVCRLLLEKNTPHLPNTPPDRPPPGLTLCARLVI